MLPVLIAPWLTCSTVMPVTLSWHSKQEGPLQKPRKCWLCTLVPPSLRTVSWTKHSFYKLSGLGCFVWTAKIWPQYQPTESFLFVFSKGGVLWGHQREIQSPWPSGSFVLPVWFHLFWGDWGLRTGPHACWAPPRESRTDAAEVPGGFREAQPEL